MKLKDAINNLGANSSMEIAEELARELGIDWDNDAKYVFSAIVNDPERVPGNIGGKNDNEAKVIKKWILKYKNGYDGRASCRASNLPGTVADPILEDIIGSRINGLSEEDLKKITYAHRLSMSAENILGLILEEYLAENLRHAGWHCAWGETVKSVDFVNRDGKLLQIKNRSNSENSSSSAIRAGTTIEKWYRIKASRIEYMWENLNEICGVTNLSEDDFVNSAIDCVTSNPECLAVEGDNPWDV